MSVPRTSFRATPAGVPRSGARFRRLGDTEVLRELISLLPIAFYISGENGEILDGNQAFMNLLGIASIDELSRYSVQELLADPAQRDRQLEKIAKDGGVTDYELCFVRRPDQLRFVLDTCYLVHDPETGESFYHGVLVDITERKKLEMQLREQSRRDPLTGCFNRRFLTEVEQSFVARGETNWGAVYIDIDHFKQYNETHGHVAGDRVLVEMSHFLTRQLRAHEAVVRVGGDEFLVVLEGADETGARVVAERLRSAALKTAPVQFSLGWASRVGEETFEQTVNRADRDLIEVKVEARSPGRRGKE